MIGQRYGVQGFDRDNLKKLASTGTIGQLVSELAMEDRGTNRA